MGAHTEPGQEEYRMDYSEWNNINIIPLVILGGFIIAAVSIFI